MTQDYSKLWKLVVAETHPIQYKIPWFRQLHAHPNVDLTVLYSMIPDAHQQGTGFGVEFQWDLPLLEGYSYQLLDNISKNPGTGHFSGCDTPGVYEKLKELQPDAVLINGWVVKSMLQALFAARRLRIPAILRCEANDLRPRAWWKTLIHRFLIHRFSAFICIGRSNRDFYLNRGVPADRIFNGYYCIESDRFAEQSTQARKDRASLRAFWNIPEDAVCFVFSGKFEGKKRPMDILEALRRLINGETSSVTGQYQTSTTETNNQEPRTIFLLMVGDGDLKRECKEYAEKNQLPVTFTGFLNQSEIPKAYAVSDCMILPSDYGETWGLVVNEAMACGLPAIVSDHVGSYLDLIVPGETGTFFPFGDVQALTGCMKQFASNPNQLVAMGETAREHICGYSIDQLAKGTLDAVGFVGRKWERKNLTV